ncbi:MAG: fatty acid desaturase [Sphingomonas sp.]|uniref:fatty acid desaturase family protein n=1 Tax=Sphingomonas sp. TaxID=28214 RepID=UPI00356AA343
MTHGDNGAIDAQGAAAGTARIRLSGIADDRALLRAAAELTRDLQRPDPRIYWSDFLGSTALGYAALAGAILSHAAPLAILCGVVAVLALYRATLFIHEITHLNPARLPGFRVAWNLLLGIPTMLPSFMYEGIHAIHHNRTRYGTVDDPEYLPLALMKPWTLPLFLLVAVLMPLFLLLRFGVLGPLSLFSPPLRRIVVGRLSGLQINPRYVRRAPEGDFARRWFRQELGASLVAITIIVTLATGLLPPRPFLIAMAVLSGVAILNQVRTLVAHLWENDGAPLTVTAQFLDSTNVPGGVLTGLWAPVGLRFHALHHLLASLPYHALGEAHRRITAATSGDTVYDAATHTSLAALVRRLAASTMRQRHGD